ncbi:MAG: acyltransferase family protein [Methanothrix sp.]|nr:acyltransferase family protein [Methanothrix sp.]
MGQDFWQEARNATRDRSVPIDILKGLAIISVILLHSWDSSTLLRLGAPYYISQAVPIFIIISGYNGVKSYLRAGATTFGQCYNNTPRRLSRLIYPYSIILAIEILFILFVNLFENNIAGMLASVTGRPLEHIHTVIHEYYGDPHIFTSVITGGYGPGSFFVPVLIPLVIILPILYLLARRNLSLMLFGTFCFTLVFEAYALKSEMPDWIYRLTFIRYLFAFGLGIWLALGKGRTWSFVGGIMSAIYITGVNYFGFTPLAQQSWGSQNALAFVWPLVLVEIGLSVAPKHIGNICIRCISEIGQASYHIFLIQMVYFWTLGWFINTLSSASFIINVILCVLIGYAFYCVSYSKAAKGKALKYESN